MSELTVRRIHPHRVAAVTAGLSVAGAAAGAGLGVVIAWVSGGFTAAPSAVPIVLSAAAIGAVHGAAFLPAIAWILFRRVPIGRALLWTSMATTWAAVAGLAFSGLSATAGVLGGTIGLVASSWWLRRSARRSRMIASG